MSDEVNLGACRDCGKEVSLSAGACPHCGAPRPADAAWNGWGYEYQSAATLFGLPLVHIAFGRDKYRRLRVARGMVVIGQFGRGIITIAQFGVGVVFVGQFGFGLLATGQFALGLAVLAQFGAGLYVTAQIGAALLQGHGQILFRP